MSNERANHEACVRFQQFYDSNLCRDVGTRAPAPIEGQSVNEYRADACRTFKKTYLLPDHPLAKVNYRRLVADGHLDVFANFERMLIPACREGAYDPRTVPEGQMREIRKRDPLTDTVQEIRFIGQESFVKAMGRPGRRVVGFRTDQGYVNTSGTVLR
jgi:hypothetical protein